MVKESGMVIREIGISRLVAHPKNANVMSAKMRGKLRRHIEKTGRYEPLVVRRHPTRRGCFELINGHHRKEILEELGYAKAACLVWELDDAEALLLLATINRLGGEDAPGKRLELIEALSKGMEDGAEELALWLPEDEATLGKLLNAEAMPAIGEAPELRDMPEAFTVFLKSGEKERLRAALRRTDRDLAVAIMKWVERETRDEKRD